MMHPQSTRELRPVDYLLVAFLLVVAALPTSILGSAMVHAEPMPIYASR